MGLGLTQMVEGKAPIGNIENGSLPSPSGPLPFRIYTPVAAATEPLPCIVTMASRSRRVPALRSV
jgi:hypothetical protein